MCELCTFCESGHKQNYVTIMDVNEFYVCCSETFKMLNGYIPIVICLSSGVQPWIDTYTNNFFNSVGTLHKNIFKTP